MAEAAARAEGFREVFRNPSLPASGDAWGRLEAALADDFNTPDALALMHEWRDHGLLRRALDVFGLATLAEQEDAPSDAVPHEFGGRAPVRRASPGQKHRAPKQAVGLAIRQHKSIRRVEVVRQRCLEAALTARQGGVAEHLSESPREQLPPPCVVRKVDRAAPVPGEVIDKRRLASPRRALRSSARCCRATWTSRCSRLAGQHHRDPAHRRPHGSDRRLVRQLRRPLHGRHPGEPSPAQGHGRCDDRPQHRVRLRQAEGEGRPAIGWGDVESPRRGG